MTRLACLHGGTWPRPAGLDPRVKAALERYAPQYGLEVEWVNTSASLQVYADELEKRWDQGEDLIVVEQDKEPHVSCFPSLLGCDEWWCAYAYWINPVPHTKLAIGGFGVTKFSAQCQREIPVSAFRGQDQRNIDRRFYDYLTANHGKGCHLHGHVVHHHVYEPRPESVRRHADSLRAQGILPPGEYPEPLAPHLLPGSYDLTPG